MINICLLQLLSVIRFPKRRNNASIGGLYHYNEIFDTTSILTAHEIEYPGIPDTLVSLVELYYQTIKIVKF